MLDLQDPGLQKTAGNEKQQLPVGTLTQQYTDSLASPLQRFPASNPDWDKKIIKNRDILNDWKTYASKNSKGDEGNEELMKEIGRLEKVLDLVIFV